MAAPRHLTRPPIREALIDFRVASDPAIDVEHLNVLRSELADSYPGVEEKRAFQTELRVEAGKIVPPSTTDLGFVGLFLTSADKDRVAQFRRDGFTLNQLAGYTTADDLGREALRLWEHYRRLVQPVAITRVAMRYINAMALPYRPGDDFKKYLTAPPDMPPATPNTVSSFLSRLVAHSDPDIVVLTLQLDTAQDDKTPVVLDIDAFCPVETTLDDGSITETLSRLRRLKNEVFFASLTDEAVELYV